MVRNHEKSKTLWSPRRTEPPLDQLSGWLRGVTLIQLTSQGSLVLQVILSSSSCAASPQLISARPHSLSLSQQAQCGPLCLVMVVQCAVCTLLTLLSTSQTRSQSSNLQRLIKAIASIARPSLEQVWSGKGWCGVWCSQNSHAAGLQSRSQTRPWDSWLAGPRRSNAPSVSRQKLFCTKTTAAVAAMRSILEWRGGWNIVSRAWERKLRTSDSTL